VYSLCSHRGFLRINNNSLASNDGGKVTVLVFLDPSGAVNIIDYEIVLVRLETDIGITAHALSWFTTYLTARTQGVSCGGHVSSSRPVACDAPQRTVMGP